MRYYLRARTRKSRGRILEETSCQLPTPQNKNATMERVFATLYIDLVALSRSVVGREDENSLKRVL